ncbi:MAG: TldE/PmbA family protein [Burkholderiaceae bacterium]|nr:TldE/PmbA family protein [Burkholderiaceae bacterium]MEB2350199.1 metallopeptidase TldD-related protein [Burkholderiaceae bacterium]
MTADPLFATQFASLARFVSSAATRSEILFGTLRGERSDFLRLNRARVRQAGTVERVTVGLRLLDGGRQGRIVCTLGEHERIDALLAGALAGLRTAIAQWPPDPWACWQPLARESEHVDDGDTPDPAAAIDAILDAAGDDDLVGLYAGGPVVRALASSLGHRHYHQTTWSSFDFSVQAGDDRAVKDHWFAGRWDAASLQGSIRAARERVRILRRPPRRLAPGDYRVLLAPQALAELVGLLGWGGFSERAWRSGQSPLARAVRGDARFAAGLTLVEDVDAFGVPRFQDDGFERPARITLLEAGRPAQRLVAPRSAREFGTEGNGADDAERPLAACVAPGALPAVQALAALDSGVSIANLWYLNYSDREACRATGMTRFATLWVENGVPVAPVEPMRFDDSLYRVLGEQLLALTDSAVAIPAGDTWNGREPGGIRAPAALVGALRFTL